MQETRTVLSVLGILVILIIAQAGDFKAYFGVERGEHAAADAVELSSKAGITSKTTASTMNDSFEMVAAFYRGIAKKYDMPGMRKRGPQVAMFLFDSGNDFASSKLLAKVQRPVPGLYQSAVKEIKSRELASVIHVDTR